VPGALVLGVYHGAYKGDKKVERRHLDAAEKLASTCWSMYDNQPSGISPETVYFSGNSIKARVKYYILRPETVESFFYMWRITKQNKWRDRGWAVFKALEEKCAVPGWGYVPLSDVTQSRKQDKDGKMHSYFMAETLKYLYLLFADESVISIDEYVFNTEAHPLKVQKNIPWTFLSEIKVPNNVVVNIPKSNPDSIVKESQSAEEKVIEDKKRVNQESIAQTVKKR